MKAWRPVAAAVLVILGTSCASDSSWYLPWEQSDQDWLQIDYSDIPLEQARVEIQELQAQETAAQNRKAAARETFETLKEDYKFAGDEVKPEVAARLVEAEAVYLDAQKQHVNAKRALRAGENAYVRKLAAVQAQGEAVTVEAMGLAPEEEAFPAVVEIEEALEGSPAPESTVPRYIELPPQAQQPQGLAPPSLPPIEVEEPVEPPAPAQPDEFAEPDTAELPEPDFIELQPGAPEPPPSFQGTPEIIE